MIKYVKASESDMFADVKISVYDIDAFIKKELDGKFQTFDYIDGAAILLKDDGSGCIVDDEAVGESFDSTSKKIAIGINSIEGKEPDKDGHRTLYIMPSHQVYATIDEIMQEAPVRTMTVAEFFQRRNYNSRLQNNFRNIEEYL